MNIDAGTQGQKAMGETGGNPQLVVVVLGQLGANPLRKGDGRTAQIDRHRKNSAAHHGHQLALRLLDLVVQPPNDAL